MSIDSEGKAKLNLSTRRSKGFPSIEGFAYRIIQGELVIQVLFKKREHDPSDLSGSMDEPLSE